MTPMSGLASIALAAAGTLSIEICPMRISRRVTGAKRAAPLAVRVIRLNSSSLRLIPAARAHGPDAEPFLGLVRTQGYANPFPTKCWDREFADSPLEGSGFEPSVPLVDAGLFGRNGKEITRVRERCSRIRQ